MRRIFITSIVAAVAAGSLCVPMALALESSSASFEIHAGNVESFSGPASSASFGTTTVAAGGQNAPSGATTTGATVDLFGGILHWFLGLFVPQYTLEHYRWRNDDGGETTATWYANEDTQATSFPLNAIKRVRFSVSNATWTRGAAPQLRLEVAQTSTCSSGSYSAVPTTYGSAWVIATSTQFTDGTATTNQLSASNIVFTPGQMKSTGNTTSAITLTSQNFTEVEYAVLATSAASPGATYCFRLTDNGTASDMAYPLYAIASLSSGLAIEGALTSPVYDTGVASGVAYNSIMWNGSIGASLGTVRLQLATAGSASGPWNFVGGSTCASNDYYATNVPGTSLEITCNGSKHNNQRYFRYRVDLCSLDCLSAGQASPTVTGVVVNWSP